MIKSFLKYASFMYAFLFFILLTNKDVQILQPIGFYAVSFIFISIGAYMVAHIEKLEKERLEWIKEWNTKTS